MGVLPNMRAHRWGRIVNVFIDFEALGSPQLLGYSFTRAPGRTAATPSGLMLKVKNVKGASAFIPKADIDRRLSWLLFFWAAKRHAWAK
jgi:hypothetical protein